MQETLFQLKANRIVVPRFSVISMYVMKELALALNLPFTNDEKLQKFPFEYKIPNGLQQYKEELIQKAKDIFENKKPKKQKHILQKNKYIHLSSNYNVSEIIEKNGEKISGNKTIDSIFYVNAPHYSNDEETSYVRKTYTHSK